jgi:aarF domain-containing kinase
VQPFSNLLFLFLLGLDAFLHMLIFYNFIHADLHPGNIIVKFYKPSAYHKFQQAWSKLLGRELKDDGDIAVERISAVRHNHELMREELAKLKEEGYSPRLVFLDTGLVTELNDVNRRNFLDLFRAIAEFDGYRTGQLMVQRCRTPELVIDPDVFALKMQHIILDIKQRTFQLGQVKVANLLHTVMNMVREHHVKLEGDFVNVVVSILLLEGIGRQLDPNLDLLKSAIPVLRDFSIKDGAKGALERMKSVEDIKDSTPWLKVWFWLEAREWLASNTRENEWLILW